MAPRVEVFATFSAQLNFSWEFIDEMVSRADYPFGSMGDEDYRQAVKEVIRQEMSDWVNGDMSFVDGDITIEGI